MTRRGLDRTTERLDALLPPEMALATMGLVASFIVMMVLDVGLSW